MILAALGRTGLEWWQWSGDSLKDSGDEGAGQYNPSTDLSIYLSSYLSVYYVSSLSACLPTYSPC